MIEKIKKNKLKSVCIGLSAFLFGFITVTLFNNINDTYAVNTDPVCPAGWQAPISDVNAKYCCPKNFTYNSSNGKCLSEQYMTESDCINNYSGEAISDGINQYFHCVVDKKYREAPACYKCNSSTYVWGNYSQNKACSKTTFTYDNCKEPESSCWRCDVGNQYVWSSSQPSSPCSGGSWYKSNTITKKENCVAPTYSCYICDVNLNGIKGYSWGTSAPSETCKSGSWYKSSTITSPEKCKAPTTTTYSITFYPNASLTGNNKATWTSPGSGYYREGTAITSCNVTSGSTCSISSLPTISRDGYTFSGWSTNSSCSAIANLRTPISLGKNLTYYACWKTTTTTPTAYKATFYANGGKFSDGSTTWTKTVYGGATNYYSQMGIPTLTKSGCTADGWHDGSPTGTVYRQYFETNGNQSFYANWNCSSSGGETGGGETPTPTTYTVKYDANGGENAPKEQTKTKGKELVLSTTVPTKEGYKFVNWNTKKDGTGTSYNAGSKYTTEASVTLYAQYEKELNEEETKYTITFYTNDGTAEKSTKVVNKGNKVVKPEDPTREGYTFDGWHDKKENGKEYDFTKEVTSDISLYAYWSKIGDKTNEDVDKNSKTGDILIFIAWTAGIGALTYSVYYFKSRKETI